MCNEGIKDISQLSWEENRIGPYFDILFLNEPVQDILDTALKKKYCKQEQSTVFHISKSKGGDLTAVGLSIKNS